MIVFQYEIFGLDFCKQVDQEEDQLLWLQFETALRELELQLKQLWQLFFLGVVLPDEIVIKSTSFFNITPSLNYAKLDITQSLPISSSNVLIHFKITYSSGLFVNTPLDMNSIYSLLSSLIPLQISNVSFPRFPL